MIVISKAIKVIGCPKKCLLLINIVLNQCYLIGAKSVLSRLCWSIVQNLL